jgi:hypothetical protein
VKEENKLSKNKRMKKGGNEEGRKDTADERKDYFRYRRKK